MFYQNKDTKFSVLMNNETKLLGIIQNKFEMQKNDSMVIKEKKEHNLYLRTRKCNKRKETEFYN